jgi:hypothetical protein
MNSRGMTRTIHGLVQICAAMWAVIDCWIFSSCSSGGRAHPNSTSWALGESHPNNNGRSSEHGKYEQCKNPKDGRPVNKACRQPDAASPDNKAESCKSLPQPISNCRGTAFHAVWPQLGPADDSESCSAVVFRSRPLCAGDERPVSCSGNNLPRSSQRMTRHQSSFVHTTSPIRVF